MRIFWSQTHIRIYPLLSSTIYVNLRFTSSVISSLSHSVLGRVLKRKPRCFRNLAISTSETKLYVFTIFFNSVAPFTLRSVLLSCDCVSVIIFWFYKYDISKLAHPSVGALVSDTLYDTLLRAMRPLPLYQVWWTPPTTLIHTPPPPVFYPVSLLCYPTDASVLLFAPYASELCSHLTRTLRHSLARIRSFQQLFLVFNWSN
jgi:hypothetical protein